MGWIDKATDEEIGDYLRAHGEAVPDPVDAEFTTDDLRITSKGRVSAMEVRAALHGVFGTADAGVSLNSTAHPAGPKARHRINPASLEVVEVELPEPTELRPPAEYAGKPLHWVRADGADTIALWSDMSGYWTVLGSDAKSRTAKIKI